jgi:UDP-glucose 4-epimerase
MSRSVLVTGGGGFLGSALVPYLVARGARVASLDVATPTGGPAVEIVHADVRDEAAVDRWVEWADAVVHLAAVVGVDRYLRDPEGVLDTNVLGTRVVAQACLARRRPLLLASTSEIYGLTGGTLSEDSPRTLGGSASARWSYALSKATAEEYVRALARRGLAHTVLRYFNVYGPDLDRPGMGRVISRFLGAIREGRPLPLVDGGAATRSFCYVDDAVTATSAALDSLCTGGAAAGRAINVGRDEPVTVRHLAELLIELSGHAAGTVDVPGDEVFGEGFEDIPTRVPDLTRARELLGFEARVDLREGLRRTLAHADLLGARRPA